MNKFLFSVFAVICAFTGLATELGYTTSQALKDIIARETQNKSEYYNINNQRNIWNHTTFLNISYNKTKFSSEEFPSTTGVFPNEFKNDVGFGLQWGHTYNLHKNPIGQVLFIGIDFTWMDLNFNKYKKQDTIPIRYNNEGTIKSLPWHNEKMTLGYGMSVGPSFTFYPFSSTHSSIGDKIRLHLYFHVGYGVEAAIIKKVNEGTEIKDQWAWGHGLNTAFGADISIDHIGLGYEFRNDGNLKFKPVDRVFDTGKMKAKETISRLFLQFRF